MAPATIRDAAGTPRRPAILLSWSAAAAEDASALRFEIRLAASGEVVAAGLADRAAGSLTVSESLLPDTAYEARGRYVMDRQSAWSAWLGATTPDIRIDEDDIADLAVGTSKVAGEAISAARSFIAAHNYIYSTTLVTVATHNVTVPHSTTYIMMWDIQFTGSLPSNALLTLDLWTDGASRIMNTVIGTGVGAHNSIQLAFALAAGTRELQLKAVMQNWSTLNGVRGITLSQLYMFGAAR